LLAQRAGGDLTPVGGRGSSQLACTNFSECCPTSLGARVCSSSGVTATNRCRASHRYGLANRPAQSQRPCRPPCGGNYVVSNEDPAPARVLRDHPLPVIGSVPVIRTSVTGSRCFEVQVSGVRGATVRLGLATVRLGLASRRFRAGISRLAALMWLGNNRAGEFGLVVLGASTGSWRHDRRHAGAAWSRVWSHNGERGSDVDTGRLQTRCGLATLPHTAAPRAGVAT
jgi:hypothetical protein